MGAPTGRDAAEAKEVELFLKAGHHRLAFAVVLVKSIRWPVGLGIGSFPLIEIAKALWGFLK